jgi:GAF domain-containing protein
VPDIADVPPDWALFRDGALSQGFASALAVPMRLRDTTIGSLNLLRTAVGELDASDLVAAQALADVATIGILHEQTVRESTELSQQLQTALNRRIVIEQAKGVVAHTHDVGMDAAFNLIRAYARSHQLSVSTVAARLVDMTLTLEEGRQPG